jgi:hypothetical protein
MRSLSLCYSPRILHFGLELNQDYLLILICYIFNLRRCREIYVQTASMEICTNSANCNENLVIVYALLTDDLLIRLQNILDRLSELFPASSPLCVVWAAV